MKTAIIVHGWPDKSECFDMSIPSSSNRHWFPWIQHELVARDILAQTPEMPEAYNNMGYALLGLESYQAAQDFFNSAIDLNVNLLSAYFGLALTFAKQENYPLAIGAMETYRHRTTDDDPYLQQAYDHLQAWREAGRG